MNDRRGEGANPNENGPDDRASDAGLSELRPVVCVDLDGTLVATDTLWESLLALLRSRPLDILRVPGWLLRGRAVMKREVCKRARPDIASLPYREPVVRLLERARASGSRTCLATAADASVAMAVAEHLELFDEVIASDGRTNMKAGRKVDAIRLKWDETAFDYVGDSSADIPVWRAAGRAIVVNPRPRFRKRIESDCRVFQVLIDRHGGLRDLLRAMRVHQWVKNVLLFVPVVLAHEGQDLARLGDVAVGALTFSLLASAFYIVNDLLDLESDRKHPEKRERPFAAGRVSIPLGLAFSAGLATLAVGLAYAILTPAFALLLIGYVGMTLAYSMYLKGKLMVDVMTLAGFYTYRIIAGGVAAQVAVSPWLLAFSLFFFLSLAFVKRYSELEAVEVRANTRIPGRGYYAEDLDMIRVMGPAAGYVAVLVLALYISSDVVSELYRNAVWLWPICVCLLYWITRIWFLAHRHHMPHDPVMFAIRDRVSHLCGLVVLLLLVLATM